MATTYTDNLNLQQPDLDDDALITVLNNDMAIIDRAVNGVQNGLAIVANGNTHVAISAGQFVYVRNHTTLTEGLYVASSNIAANATLSTSNLTADSAGGLNALNSKIASYENFNRVNGEANSNYGTGVYGAIKFGDMVAVYFRIVLTASAAPDAVLATIPNGYRPHNNYEPALYSKFTNNNNTNVYTGPYQLVISTNGEITQSITGSASDGCIFEGLFIYAI